MNISLGVLRGSAVGRECSAALMSEFPEAELRLLDDEAQTLDWLSSTKDCESEHAIVLGGTKSQIELAINSLERGKHVLLLGGNGDQDLEALEKLRTMVNHSSHLVCMHSGHGNQHQRYTDIRKHTASELGRLTAVDLLASYARKDGTADGVAPTFARFSELLLHWFGPFTELTVAASSPLSLGNIPEIVMSLGTLENGAAFVEYHSAIVADARTPRQLLTVHGELGTLRYEFADDVLYFAEASGMLVEVDKEHRDGELPLIGFLRSIKSLRRDCGRAEDGCRSIDNLVLLNRKIEAMWRSHAGCQSTTLHIRN